MVFLDQSLHLERGLSVRLTCEQVKILKYRKTLHQEKIETANRELHQTQILQIRGKESESA